MSVRTPASLVTVAAAGLLAFSLSACSMGSGMQFASTKIEGHQIADDQLAQIRPGQSQALVMVVLGSPQTVNAFGDGAAWYYVQTKVAETSFGMRTILDRTVLAVYFDKNKKIVDRAIYSLKDGKLITVESRKTQGYGEDKTFIQSIIESI